MILLPVPNNFTIMTPFCDDGKWTFTESGPAYFALDELDVAREEGIARVLEIDSSGSFAIVNNAHILPAKFCTVCGQKMHPDDVVVDGEPDGSLYPAVFRAKFRCACGVTIYSERKESR